MARVNVGDEAPDFALPWTGDGDEFRLSDRRGRWVVLAFYPSDFTPTCTKQLCAYRDGREQLEELDADVVGISPQDLDSHEKFIAKYGLTVPLAADTDLAVARAYGVKGPGRLIRRSIFVVDPEGILRYRKVALVGLGYEDVGDLGQAIAAARAAVAA